MASPAFVELHHTLQTWLGMVQAGGAPARRTIPQLPQSLLDAPPFETTIEAPRTTVVNLNPRPSRKFDNVVDGRIDAAYTEVAAECILAGSLPHFRGAPREARYAIDILRSNISACRDPSVTKETLRGFINTRRRVDLEQAAGTVVAAIINDESVEPATKREAVISLLRELRLIVTTSCMWFSHEDKESAEDTSSKFVRFAAFVHEILAAYRTGEEKESASPPTEWNALLRLLLRVRRSAPADRCLQLPKWMFTEAGLPMPPAFAVWNEASRTKGMHPSASPPLDALQISRHHFRALQRRLLQYFHFWDPKACFHRAVLDLEDAVVFCSDFVRARAAEAGCPTLLLAHYFFAYQRWLQRKIVSDLGWTTFLPKGQTMAIMQNNPDIPTTFERALMHLAGQAPEALTLQRDGEALIDRCCLLMEAYVRLYGREDRNNLVFEIGVRGGSGRGPVDDYNLLVDVLHNLRKDATAKGLKAPGHVQKFLAKDIMSWNNAWADDAFAGGKVPGWEPWLAERRASSLGCKMRRDGPECRMYDLEGRRTHREIGLTGEQLGLFGLLPQGSHITEKLVELRECKKKINVWFEIST